VKSSDYWKKRSEEVAIKQYRKLDQYISSMQLEYEIAKLSIQKDIELFYARFSQNNNVSLADAKKLLNSNGLKEFKMTLEEFRRKSIDNVDDIWTKQLNNVYYKTRVSRLEALQSQIQAKINAIVSSNLQGGKELLKNIYKDTYYRNIYEIHKGLGIGVNFAKLDNNTIDTVMNESWHGGNYSSRIWSNKEKLVAELQVNLTQAFIRGDSIDKTISIVAERMNVARNRAITLVSTESAYITSKATFNSYSRSGVVKQYEILATLDLKTSEICRSLDGNIFNLSEKLIGVNAPPFHPRCRTTIMAYFDDAVDEERIARDNDGNVYYVDGNMSYQDWYNKHVKDNPKEEQGEKKIQNKSSDKQQYAKYKEILGNQAPKSFDKFQELKYNNVNEWENSKVRYGIRAGEYDLTLNKQAYEKHLEGHKRFDDYTDRLRSKGSNHIPSSLTISYDKAQELIKSYAGTGEIITNRGQVKELIRGNNELVGTYRDIPNGIEEKTTNFSIHYSKSDKKGAHIVPMKEE
jgi:SPP1 gp7 family putative phage head morphogenesis protein